MKIRPGDELEARLQGFMDHPDRIDSSTILRPIRFHVPTGVVDHPIEAPGSQCLEDRIVENRPARRRQVVSVSESEHQVQVFEPCLSVEVIGGSMSRISAVASSGVWATTPRMRLVPIAR